MKNLVSVGSLFAPIISYKLHTHTQWELIYYTSGTGTITIEDTSYPFENGTVIAVPPGTAHTDTAKEGYTNLYVYFINTELPPVPFCIQDTSSRDIYSILLILQREYLLHQSNHEEIITALMDTVFAYINVITQNQRKNTYVEAMKQSIIENFSDPRFTAQSIYHVLNINQDYARRLFVKEMGTTPSNFLRQTRINKAKVLLGLTDQKLSVSEIAFQCGFSDQYHFSKLFKITTGVSPSYWKKQHQG